METSAKSKQSKKGRNKRITNNRGRGDVFIKKPPVCLVRNKSADLNREMEQTAKSEKSVEPEPVSEKPQVSLTTEEPQLDVNSEEQQVAVAHNKPHIDVTLKEPHVAVIPKESLVAVVSGTAQVDVSLKVPEVAVIPKESLVAVVSDTAEMDVTLKEPQVAVIHKESPVAVVSDKPQMDVTQNQQQDSGIPTEVKKYFEELCKANASQKVIFVNGQLGLPVPLLRAARKQYLDSQLAPPPRVNPWTARAAMFQKNCQKADFPSSQITSQVAARPNKTQERKTPEKQQLTVIPKKVAHKQPQPPKENPWLKSIKAKETIHPLEISEADFPPLRAKKCVVAPEKRHQAVKALNIKKITGSVYQQPRKGHYRLCMLWRTGSQLPVIPEEPELDVIIEEIWTEDLEPSNTPQQTPTSKATSPAEAFFQQTGIQMTAVPEIDFMEGKSQEIVKLEQEQEALLKEVEQLREMLQTQRALQAQEETKHQARVETLQLEISNTETSEKEALCKVSELEEALKKEISPQSDIERSMLHLRAENARLVAALTQAEEDTATETIQWKEEKSNLLRTIKKQQQILQDEMNRATLMDSADNQSGESSGVVAVQVQGEEEKKQETLQEEEEESSLLQTISVQQQALKNDQVQAGEDLIQEVLQWEVQTGNQQQQQAFESVTSRNENQDRHDGPEEQVAVTLNRPRRLSLWKRFKRLFKRTARPPVPPPVPPPSSQPS